MKEKIRLGFLGLTLVAAFCVVSITYRVSYDWWLVDDCLSGKHGSFDYSKMSCDLEENHPYIPYRARHPHDKQIGLLGLISFPVFLSGYWYGRINSKKT